jgi:hypothetical protein
VAERDRESRIFRAPIEETFAHANADDPDLQAVLDEFPYFAERSEVQGALRLTFDLDGLFLSILGVGQRGEAFGAAHWLFQHIAAFVDPINLNDAIEARRHRLETALSVKPDLAFPKTIAGLDRLASLIAQRTDKREYFDLHHLLAAMLRARDEWTRRLPSFGTEPGVLQYALSMAHEELLDWIARNNDVDVEAWGHVFSGKFAEEAAIEVQAPKPEDANSIPVSLIPGFSTDRASAEGDDSLGVDDDVQAFARLICLKEVRPPLSIGLFGGWGAGKSTFMERLQAAIRAITDAEAKRREDVAAERRQDFPKGAPGFLARITHIRFNAWQYSDANLWASLTTEFFDQLRAGGHGGQARALHDRLVLRVKEHVNGLSDTAIGTRKALAESEDALVAAEVARDDAAAKVTAKEDAVLQSLSESLAASYDRNKETLSRLGLARGEPLSGDAVKNFADIIVNLRTLPGLFDAVCETIWNGPLRWPVVSVLGLTIISGLIAIFVPGWFGAIPVTGGLASLAMLAHPVTLIARLFRDTASAARKLKEADAAARKDLAVKERDVRAKTDEVAARRATVDRAETALARYAGPAGTPSSPRLLHFLLNDDPEAKQIEGQIGLISRARRLFQAIDEIARDNSDAGVPERIVLYIDDLDRCSHEQVYAVLQAVHLLLAFELFVVVVGVDVAWVSDAIARQMRDGQQVSAEEETKRRKRAIDYLQKIFQIPFWLRPLTSEGGDGGSYGRFVKALTGSAVAAPKAEATPPVAPQGPAGEGKEVHVELEQTPGDPQVAPIVLVKPEPLPPERLLETVQLDPREVAFLQHPAIGAIAAPDPRGVKRMINTYRLARARLSRDELDKLLAADAPAYPVLALFVAIETGLPGDIADTIYHNVLAEKIGATDLDDLLRPREADQERETNAAEPALKNEQKATHQRWVTLRKALLAAREIRGDKPVFVADASFFARLVRRYSFNR